MSHLPLLFWLFKRLKRQKQSKLPLLPFQRLALLKKRQRLDGGAKAVPCPTFAVSRLRLDSGHRPEGLLSDYDLDEFTSSYFRAFLAAPSYD
jgi:hypothetical protein